MSIDYERLSKIAHTIVDIPKHYHLVMEDNTPEGDENVRSFIWADPEESSRTISVSLDLETGQLMSLDLEKETLNTAGEISSVEEARSIADAFLKRHTPHHDLLTRVHIEERQHVRIITYREEVGGIPLPHTGCRVTIDNELDVIQYDLEGNEATSKPVWPESICEEETVKQQILQEIQMKLTIVTLEPSCHEEAGTKPQYRLVYEPIPDFRMIDASTGVDLHGMDHYLLPDSRPIAPSIGVDREPIIYSNTDWLKRLGVDPEYYHLEKSADDGERIRMRYRRVQAEEDVRRAPDEKSAESYMKRTYAESFRNLEAAFLIHIEKSTGRIVAFHRKVNQEDAPRLSREQCWEQAEQFLRQVFPDYHEYLQLEDEQEEMDGELRDREVFFLPVVIGNTPVKNESVLLSVSTSSGKIIAYRGVSYDMLRTIAEHSFQPRITADEAFERYAEHVRLKLKWYEDTNDNGYRLIYEQTTTMADGGKQKLLYIDACSGATVTT